MTYDKLLKEAEQKIKDKGLEYTVAKILLTYVSELSLQELYINLNNKVSKTVINKFNKALNLYLIDKQPVQYITGVQPFYGYDFLVNKNVLIPRYETEELVEHIIFFVDKYYGNKQIEILDIGTGSGCIAITLDKEIQQAKVTATDISEKALEVARKNNKKLKANTNFILSDLFNDLDKKKYNVIVSNPPYIPVGEKIGPTVKHEPEISLYGGKEGLDYYKIIIKESVNYLKENGMIAFEHAYNKAQEIKDMIEKTFNNVKVYQFKDLSGRDRITIGKIGE